MENFAYLGAIKDNGTLGVSGGGGGGAAGRSHLRSDKHRLLLAPEVVLTENEV